jgi:undecaprenyl-diphosphatase
VVRRVARYWWLFLVVALLAAFVALAVASRVGSGLSGWDQHVHDVFLTWRTPVRSRAFWLFTLSGDDVLMASLATAAVVLAWAWGRRALAAAAAGGQFATWAVMEVMKVLVGRPRPSQALALIDQPISQSMPSAHTVMSLLFGGLLVYALFRWSGRRRRLGVGRVAAVLRWVGLVAGVVAVATIGVSRVYLGVHWLSDVLADWCLGGACLIVTLRVAAEWELTGGPAARLRDVGPWARHARWRLAALVLLVVCGTAVLAGRLDPLH